MFTLTYSPDQSIFSGHTKLVTGRTMFLSRTGRLSAAALDQTFRSTGSVLAQVKIDRLRKDTLTLRKDYTFQGHRCFCVSVRGVESSGAHKGQQQPEPRPILKWDTSPDFVITDWGHLNRVAAIAGNLLKSAQSAHFKRQPLVHGSRREPGVNVLFTGNWGVSSRSCSSWTMQTRASSTKTSDAGEEQAADNKGVI